MVFPTAILVCRTARRGLPGKERTCYAGYSVVKVQRAYLYMLSGECIKDALEDLLDFHGLRENRKLQ